VLDLTHIRRRLAAPDPRRHAQTATTRGEAPAGRAALNETATPRQAAVAIILRQHPAADTEVLFIKRAERPGDPWSGQMAFPGGHRDPTDRDLRSAAVRETAEEIGVDLDPDRYLGPIEVQRPSFRGRSPGLLVAPFVFELEGEVECRLNHEVDEVVWAPLKPLHGGDWHDWEPIHINGTRQNFNGFRLAGGHFVWGLTYRMLKVFFATLDPHWQPPPEVD